MKGKLYSFLLDTTELSCDNNMATQQEGMS